jgi:hypothetical protein
VFREDDLIAPLEGVSVLIVCGNESVDLIAHPPWGGEAGAGQGMAGEDEEKTSTWLSQEACVGVK